MRVRAIFQVATSISHQVGLCTGRLTISRPILCPFRLLLTAPGGIGWWPSQVVTFLDDHETGSAQALIYLECTNAFHTQVTLEGVKQGLESFEAKADNT
ncbi:hypothetical protein CTI12_AA079860 [Artemisia annua]|uniref:Uncharacterized protein n=1 Tax=Artemisia annua TaxID=35608 RepID=A0A2U1Q2Y5_ARTAN|nr:hypothetical protein CTI12_AA079860 [Artemisia annua]